MAEVRSQHSNWNIYLCVKPYIGPKGFVWKQWGQPFQNNHHQLVLQHCLQDWREICTVTNLVEILQEFFRLLMNPRLLLHLFAQQLKEQNMLEDVIRRTFMFLLLTFLLDPPRAGQSAAPRPCPSLFLSAPDCSLCRRSLPTARSSDASGLWWGDPLPEGQITQTSEDSALFMQIVSDFAHLQLIVFLLD